MIDKLNDYCTYNYQSNFTSYYVYIATCIIYTFIYTSI